ncbi:MAG: tetratricopeptide repeat protein [Candidatus Eisenbacteria bacterium]|nr:tetratricopeptide repeat protein [Candidatus Eisenbacteria bacterium]
MALFGRLFARSGTDHYRRGILRFNEKNYEAAAEAFEQVLASVQDESSPYHSLSRFYAAEAHAKLGLSLREQGRIDEAALQFERALASGYRYPDLHYLLARIHEEKGDHSGAEARCRRALEINAEYHEARATLAIALGRQGRHPEALAELRVLADSGFALPARLNLDLTTHLDEEVLRELRQHSDRRKESQEHLHRALDAYNRADLSGAIEEMRLAVEQRPTYADLHCKLGILYVESGALELAERAFRRALEINPRYVEARLQLGLVHLRSGRLEIAAEELRAAHGAEPQYPDLALYLALASLRNGEVTHARELLTRALEQNPHFHRARYLLALVLAADGNSEAALAELERAIAGDSNLVRGAHDLAYTYLQRGDRERSLGVFAGVVQRHPDFPDAQLGLGLVLLAAGRTSEARAHLERAVALQPRFVRALEALARIELSEGDPNQAVSLIARALEQAPHYPDLHYLSGRALEMLGREREAELAYQAAIDRHHGYIDARVALGLSLLKSGEVARGRAEMEQVLRIDPVHPVARAFADPDLIDQL